MSVAALRSVNGGEPSRRLVDPRHPLHTARALVAAEFTDASGHQLLLRHRGTFWRYARNVYLPADDELVRKAIWEFLDGCDCLDEKDRPVPLKPNRARVSEIVDALIAVCALDAAVEPPAWLDLASTNPPPSEFVAVGNGLLHLPTGELYPPSPTFFGLSASDVEFSDGAPLPSTWLAFLNQLWPDDPDSIAALQDWFGYCLAPDTSQQKILLMVGPPRSGKGTIARVLTALVGRDSVAGPTLAGLSTNFGLEPLIGKPLAIISDARLGARSDQASIAERLLSISGEDSLTIDRKHRPAWTGRLPTRFALLTNELPNLADASGALVRRFVILSLGQSFYGREDPLLTDRLLAELPGILNWARVGYQRLRARGHFLQPASARDAIEVLEAMSSPIRAFVRERCRLGAGLQTPAQLLYTAWCEWCDASGRKPSTAQVFGRDLRSAFPAIRKPKQTRAGDDRLRVYEGIALAGD